MRPFFKAIGGDVRAALVSVATLALLGSLYALWSGILNFIKQQPWTVAAAIGAAGIALSTGALVVLWLSSRKRPELTPFTTRFVGSNGKYRLQIGVKNVKNVKASDPQITVLFWRCSGQKKPFSVRRSIGNAISKDVPELIEIDFSITPVEPVFVVISFSHRSGEKGRIREQHPSFYYKWNGSDSTLTHVTTEERELIVERLKEKATIPPPIDFVEERVPPDPTVSELVRRSVELMEERKLRFPLYALQIAGAGNLNTEAQFMEACEKLEQYHVPHPLKNFSERNNWLELIKFANREEVSLSDPVATYDCLQKFYMTETAAMQPVSDTRRQERLQCLERAALLLKAPAKVLWSMNALCQAGAHRMERNDDVVWVCEQLQAQGHAHPFEDLETHVPKGDWLEFLQALVLRPDVQADISGDYILLAEQWPRLRGNPEPLMPISLNLKAKRILLERQGA